MSVVLSLFFDRLKLPMLFSANGMIKYLSFLLIEVLMSIKFSKILRINFCFILAFAGQSIRAFLDDPAKQEILQVINAIVQKTYAIESWSTNGFIVAYKAFLIDLKNQDVNTFKSREIAEGIFEILNESQDYKVAFQAAIDSKGTENELASWNQFISVAANKTADIIESRIEGYKACRDPKDFTQWMTSNSAFDLRTDAALQIQAAHIVVCKIRQIVRENKTIN